MLKKILTLIIAVTCFLGMNQIINVTRAIENELTFNLEGKLEGEEAKITIKLTNNSEEDKKISIVKLAIKAENAEPNGANCKLEGFSGAPNWSKINSVYTLLYDNGELNLGAGACKEIAEVNFKELKEGYKISVKDKPEVTVGEGFSIETVYCDIPEIKFESEIVEVSGVKLDKESLELEEGETAELKATVEPENATEKEVKWTSSDDSVATVTDGIVTAVKAGKATIKALCGEKEATAEIEVLAKETPEPTPEPTPDPELTPAPEPTPEPEQKPESTPKDETGNKVEATVTVPENKEETTEEKSEPSNNETVVTRSSKQPSTGENNMNVIGLGVLMMMSAGVLLNEKKRKSK